MKTNCRSPQFIQTPLYVVSGVVGALKQYFGTPDRLTTDYSSFLWSQDERQTKVRVSQDYNSSSDSVGFYPSIFVSIPQITFKQEVIQDLMAFNPLEGEVRNIEVNRGQLRLRCVADSSLASIELATEVKYFISVFRQQIQHDYCIDQLRQSGISGPQRVDEYKEYWTTDVLCDILYQENWGVVIEHLKIKSINIVLEEK